MTSTTIKPLIQCLGVREMENTRSNTISCSVVALVVTGLIVENGRDQWNFKENFKDPIATIATVDKNDNQYALTACRMVVM